MVIYRIAMGSKGSGTGKQTSNATRPKLAVREATAGNLNLVTLDQAASNTGKTVHNIRDYIQRGRIAKYDPSGRVIARAKNGELRVSLTELRHFLSLVEQGIERHHNSTLHADLGFYDVPEYLRTKHVHRLHPYLGKFIPQLVEWFLHRFCKAGDYLLDPFMGSGTTLVQANEMGMNAIGVDISPFNCQIARVKLANYNVEGLRSEVLDIENRLQAFASSTFRKSDIESTLFTYEPLADEVAKLVSSCDSEYLKSWFSHRCLAEMLVYRDLIPNYSNQEFLQVLLSRAVRSSRLVPHYDLATPKSPLQVGQKYWCRKHKRYCVPIDNCLTKIHAYSLDSVRRVAEFATIRRSTMASVIQGDARLPLTRQRIRAELPQGRLLDAIFTSPPYVGQIDYHEQHTYAYELFGFPRQDELEIGPKKRGKSVAARKEYVEGIVAVLRNVTPLIRRGGLVFIVANDRFGLYPEIASQSGLKIVEKFHRAVTKRTEQGDDPYQETIFMMRRVEE